MPLEAHWTSDKKDCGAIYGQVRRLALSQPCCCADTGTLEFVSDTQYICRFNSGNMTEVEYMRAFRKLCALTTGVLDWHLQV